MTCAIVPHFAALCEKCGRYGDYRHVVRENTIDAHGTEVSTANVYCDECCPVNGRKVRCAEHCPVCKPGKEAA